MAQGKVVYSRRGFCEPAQRGKTTAQVKRETPKKKSTFQAGRPPGRVVGTYENWTEQPERGQKKNSSKDKEEEWGGVTYTAIRRGWRGGGIFFWPHERVSGGLTKNSVTAQAEKVLEKVGGKKSAPKGGASKSRVRKKKEKKPSLQRETTLGRAHRCEQTKCTGFSHTGRKGGGAGGETLKGKKSFNGGEKEWGKRGE